MATAVLDIDLEQIPENIGGLDHYSNALILIRYKGKPIGKTYVPVKNKQLSYAECYEHMMQAVNSTYWKHWLHDYLNWDEQRDMSASNPLATITVCTRDRTDDLKRCLDALMQLPNDGQEILIIDNCPSTDETKKLVATYAGVTYILEPKPGLDNARNRALREAKHEIVAFTDDDALPDPNWLRAMVNNFNNPNVMCVTGLTMPLELETKAQEEFERYSPFGKGFQRVVHTSTSRNPLATGQVGAGANMALRKSVIDKIGLFDEALDAGTATHSGGDHEMFARILIEGYQIIYDPSVLSWHRHRRTWKELHKAIYGYGVGVYALFTKHLFTNFELSVFYIAFAWFRYDQFKNLAKALLRRRGSLPLDLILAELEGCLAGPYAYFKARRKASAS